jgi:hypothetical protein
MDLDISEDVFSAEVLDSVSFAEMYTLRQQYPEIYMNRVNRPAELFLKLLVAIVYDDIGLFEIAWEQSEGKFFTNIIVDLVANTMADRDVAIAPYRIFVFLLRGNENYSLKAHLRLDYTLFGLLIQDEDLIELMIHYAATRTSPRLIWTIGLDISITNPRYEDPNPINPDNLLNQISWVLIGDLVESYYPGMVGVRRLTDEQRNRLLTRRTDLIQRIWTAQAGQDNREGRLYALEDIRSLGAYTQPPANFTELNRVKRFTPYYAAFWYNALFNPDNYPELVPIINNGDINLIFEVMEGTLIRPSRFIDAELDYLSHVDNDVRAQYSDNGEGSDVDPNDLQAEISYRIRSGINAIDTLIGMGDADVGMDQADRSERSGLISRSGRRVAASRLLQWLTRQEELGDRSEVVTQLQPYRLGLEAIVSGR